MGHERERAELRSGLQHSEDALAQARAAHSAEEAARARAEEAHHLLESELVREQTRAAQCAAELKEVAEKHQAASHGHAEDVQGMRVDAQQRHEQMQQRCAELHADVVLHKTQLGEHRSAAEIAAQARVAPPTPPPSRS